VQAGLIGAVPTGLAYLAALNPLYLSAVLVTLGLLYVVLTRAETMLLILVAFLPWEGYLGYPTQTLTVVKVLGLLLMISYLVRALVSGASFVSAPALAPVGLLSLALLGSLILSADPGVGLLGTSRYLLYIVFFLLVLQLSSDRARIAQLMRVFVLSAALAAVVGVIGVISGAQARAMGPIKDPNDFAYLLSTTIPLAAYLCWSAARLRWIWLFAALVSLAGVLATFSRGALVGLGVLLVWSLLTRRVPLRAGLAFVATGLLLVLVAFTAFGGTLSVSLRQKSNIASRNVDSRTAFWVASLQMTADHPLVGIGPGRLPEELPSYVRNDPVPLDEGNGHILVVHNSYLEILTEEGPVALLCFLAFLLAGWSGLRRVSARARARGDDDALHLADSLRGALIVAMVGAFFISIQTGPPFWLLGGLASAMLARGGVPGIPGRSARPTEADA
jgi:putative inorganic carbon (HCO3(-)) transporter